MSQQSGWSTQPSNSTANNDVSTQIDIGTNRAEMLQTRRQWIPKTNVRAVALIVHTLSEHSERYEALGQALAQASIGALAIDQRGHGTSEGKRGHIDSYAEYLDDIEDQIIQMRELSLPVVLLGHGLGALSALRYSLDGRSRPDLLVTSTPAIDFDLMPWDRFLVSNMAKIAPHFFVPLNIDPEKLCSDPQVVDSYKKDPLIRFGATTTLLNQILITQKETLRDLHELDIPTLCLHGRADTVLKPRNTLALEDIDCVERELLWGSQHDIYHEPGGEAITKTIDWLDIQLEKLAQGSA